MSYGTSVPFIMRKTKLSHDAALKKINWLVDEGLINKTELLEQFLPNLSLKFTVISKYGRDLFYPNDNQSKFITCHLLKQKTATFDQLKSMREFGWDIQYSENETVKP